jgi:hypothetical protein
MNGYLFTYPPDLFHIEALNTTCKLMVRVFRIVAVALMGNRRIVQSMLLL